MSLQIGSLDCFDWIFISYILWVRRRKGTGNWPRWQKDAAHGEGEPNASIKSLSSSGKAPPSDTKPRSGSGKAPPDATTPRFRSGKAPPADTKPRFRSGKAPPSDTKPRFRSGEAPLDATKPRSGSRGEPSVEILPLSHMNWKLNGRFLYLRIYLSYKTVAILYWRKFIG